MGNYLWNRRSDQERGVSREDGWPPIVDGPFKDGDIYQVWSLMSVSKDQYLNITNQVPETTKYIVNASGEADPAKGTLPFIKITFKDATSSGTKWYYMVFDKDNKKFRMTGAETGITAVQETGGPEDTHHSNWWLPWRMEAPNQGFWAFESKMKSRSGKTLYLSSDGQGNLKLREWKQGGPPPPIQNYYVDVGFLFRVVGPFT